MALSNRNTVFVSYSHKDKAWLEDVLPHLRAASRFGDFEVWSDLDVRQGEDWHRRIHDVVDRTKFAVCLVSANFLSSSFCMDEEIPHFLENAEQDLQILPVLVRPCPWQSYPWLNRLQLFTVGGKALSSARASEQEEVFARLAERIHEASQPGYEAPPPPPPTGIPPIKCDISKLPETGPLLFGRRKELNNLDQAWDRQEANIVIFKAHGGVGKSTLVRVWTEQMAEDNYRGAKMVYAWSFYSQGTSERVTSADQFIAAALEFFGDPDPQKGSAWDRGERLAELVANQRTLLLLDGMEPLQSGHEFDRGEIKDPALKTLLEGLAERNTGLCIISTREEVKDLEGAIERVDLEKVSTVAGRALLRIGGVPGNDAKLEGLVEDFGNHALALNLLAAYLKWPGAGGAEDIPELADIPEKKGRHARRVMAAFAKIFGEGPELDLLRILGLFDGPIEETVIKALLADPPIEGLTEHLSRDGARRFEDAKATLRRAKMLAGEGTHQPPWLDSHPLVREHFGEELEKERPKAWREGHRRLFEFFQEVAEYQPDTLEGLAPLYAAIGHGCAAQSYLAAFNDVYWPRILRGEEAYSINALGAFGAELAATSDFFLSPWRQVSGTLPNQIQGFLLNGAGYRLRALGQLSRAAEPMEASFGLALAAGNWQSAATIAGNLSELYLAKGDLSLAGDFSNQAVEYADRSTDWFQRVAAATQLAAVEHQQGRLAEAEKHYRLAEKLQKERQPAYPLLYSLSGFRYCDLLLAQGQSAEALRRATQTLTWMSERYWILGRALDLLTIGRAALADGDLLRAEGVLSDAVAELRASGRQDQLPFGLLAQAELTRRQGALDRAARHVAEAERLARRGGMRLHQVDCELERCRIAAARSQWQVSSIHLEHARRLMEECGYHRRNPEIGELESAFRDPDPG